MREQAVLAGQAMGDEEERYVLLGSKLFRVRKAGDGTASITLHPVTVIAT